MNNLFFFLNREHAGFHMEASGIDRGHEAFTDGSGWNLALMLGPDNTFTFTPD
jgi:hypothetical protein